MYNSCVYSSFLFLMNIFLAYKYNHTMYSFLFFCLFITSILFHANRNNKKLKLIDKITVYLVVIYGFLVFYNKITNNNKINILIVLSFISVIYIYHYGFIINDYCFHENKKIADNYHSLVHVFTCVGHGLIIIL